MTRVILFFIVLLLSICENTVASAAEDAAEEAEEAADRASRIFLALVKKKN
jgi:hypothetical protein